MQTCKELLKIKEINRDIRRIFQVSFKGIDIINYQIEMINHNENSSLIMVEKVVFNNETQLNYDITNYIRLDSYLKENILSKGQLLDILIKICDAIIECNKYYLNSSNFILTDKAIFIDKETSKMKLVYLPIEYKYSDDINDDFKLLVKKIIMDLAIVEDSIADNYMQVILNTIKKESFTLNSFKEIIFDLYDKQVGTINNSSNLTELREQDIENNINKLEEVKQNNNFINSANQNNIININKNMNLYWISYIYVNI